MTRRAQFNADGWSTVVEGPLHAIAPLLEAKMTRLARMGVR
jgi:hypothetical protein